MYYRGTQNKRNAYIVVILESLIFSEIQNRENSGIFSNLRNFTISPSSPVCDTMRSLYDLYENFVLLIFFGILKSKTKSKKIQLKSKKKVLKNSASFEKVKVK